jgi:hypothetical protein
MLSATASHRRSVNSRPLMNDLIFLVEVAPEGGFSARALGASIFTEGDDIASLRANVRKAVRCHFDEGKAPRVVRIRGVRGKPFRARLRPKQRHP